VRLLRTLMGSMGVWILFPCVISEFFALFFASFCFLPSLLPFPPFSVPVPPFAPPNYHRTQLTSTTSLTSHQTLKKDEFYALLSVADLAVITPLQNGSLSSRKKSRARTRVLSKFMGISKNMEEALLVNPWNLGVG
jgi:hypothetical protein